MTDAFDLDAYLARIGYHGPRTPTLETLRAIHLAHPAAIPFENLDPLMGRPVRIDPAALAAKLVQGGRGGYCYEHNTLFRTALEAIGFQVSGLAARVEWNVPPGVTLPRTHMLLRVALPEGEHIADVGFGGLTLTAPLRLEPGVEQPTPHGPFRLVAQGEGAFQLQAHAGGVWRPLYRFDLTETLAADYEVANWYVSTYPASQFLVRLMAARALEGRRLALLNDTLTAYHADGTVERRTVETADALAELLTSEFGIELPEGAGEALGRVMGGGGRS
ncbi:MAG: arylamine N-acetyltransferase [Caulobacteraceae bacterium]